LRVIAVMLSTVPMTGRPSGWAPNTAFVKTSCTTSPGSSSCMAISSRITPRSVSTSAVVIRDDVSMSQTTSTASGRSVSSTRA
jgi:hypothetical protein